MVVVLLACVAAVVVAVVWPREREPEYGGKKLSEWLILYKPMATFDEVPGPERQEAGEAIHRIGTNALPHMLKWVRGRRLPMTGIILFERLPRKLQSRFVRRYLGLEYPVVSDFAAEAGFRALGPEANAAIPDLIKMLGEPLPASEPDGPSNHASSALRCIGASAIPALIAVITRTNNPSFFRVNAILALRDIAWSGNNVDAAIPGLVQCLSDPQEEVWFEAQRTLSTIAPEVLEKGGENRSKQR